MNTLADYTFEPSKVTGSGLQGSVVPAEHLPSGTKLVAKITNIESKFNEKCYFEELEALKRLKNCKGAIKMVDFSVNYPFGIVLLEKMPFDLMTLIENDSLSLLQRKTIFKLVCAALKEIHEAGVVHLDIKPENILVSADYQQVKICDFGNAKIIDSSTMVSAASGTLLYAAPELMTQKFFDGKLADIWSLGILYHVLITYHWPYANIDSSLIKENVINANLQYSPGITASDIKLMDNILKLKPEDRIDISKLCKAHTKKLSLFKKMRNLLLD